jgi:hypothetical protein
VCRVGQYGQKNSGGETVNEIDERIAGKQQKAAREQELREVDEREFEINRDYGSVYALT